MEPAAGQAQEATCGIGGDAFPCFSAWEALCTVLAAHFVQESAGACMGRALLLVLVDVAYTPAAPCRLQQPEAGGELQGMVQRPAGCHR